MRSIQGAHLVCFFSVLAAALANGQTDGLIAEAPGSAATAGEAPQGLSAGDWTEIRTAFDVGRHRAYAVDGGHRTRSPGQQWTTFFDGRGFEVTPDAGGWSWGLELVRYGWGEDLREVARPESVSAEGGCVAYAWDEHLSEWYVNDARGLEHGYTVSARLEQANGPLVIELAIRGGLVPMVSQDGRDVRFIDATGSAVLAYAGLAVFDANGRALAAGWKVAADGLELRVDCDGARYPLTIDPIAQQAYLKASNTGAFDLFGQSVSISGDTLVVGAGDEDSNATGVNGDGSNNLATNSGAAYVFVRNGATWSQEAYLKASNPEAGDFFGTSVSISGDTVVVGAIGEDSAAVGVNGNQGNGAFSSGAAYVFVRDGTSWSQQAYLKASNAGAQDHFGRSVAISGDTLVVGAEDEDSKATGVNGDENDNLAADSGAAYVFVRNGATWGQEAYLKASNTGAGDNFGQSVSLSGDTLVVGAPGEDSDATGVNGNQNNNLANGSGAAYVFVRDLAGWNQTAYLKASNTSQFARFGSTISICADTIVVSADAEDSNATGVNGQGSGHAFESGAAYIFVRDLAGWNQAAYLKASNTQAFDHFGHSVSVSGNTIVVGADGEDSNATGVNGVDNDLAPDSGAAYLFVHDGTTWSQTAYLKASNTEQGDAFGSSVSISGASVVIGAMNEDSNATGVNGDQSNNLSTESGAAYVFDLFASVSYCTAGTSASGCQALLSASGVSSATAPSGFTLSAATVEGQRDGLFFFGTNGQQANSWVNGASYQCVVPPVVRAPLMTGTGTIGLCDGSFALDLNALWCPTCPSPAKNPGAGSTVQAQLWYRDPLNTSNQTTSLSDAIEFQITP